MTKAKFLFAEIDKVCFDKFFREILFLSLTPWSFLIKAAGDHFFFQIISTLFSKLIDRQYCLAINRQLKRKQNNLQILAVCCATFSEPKTFTCQTEEMWTNKGNCNISRQDLNGLIKLQKGNNICHWKHVTLLLVCTVVVLLQQVPGRYYDYSYSRPAFCYLFCRFLYTIGKVPRSTCFLFWTS